MVLRYAAASRAWIRKGQRRRAAGMPAPDLPDAHLRLSKAGKAGRGADEALLARVAEALRGMTPEAALSALASAVSYTPSSTPAYVRAAAIRAHAAAKVLAHIEGSGKAVDEQAQLLIQCCVKVARGHEGAKGAAVATRHEALLSIAPQELLAAAAVQKSTCDEVDVAADAALSLHPATVPTRSTSVQVAALRESIRHAHRKMPVLMATVSLDALMAALRSTFAGATGSGADARQLTQSIVKALQCAARRFADEGVEGDDDVLRMYADAAGALEVMPDGTQMLVLMVLKKMQWGHAVGVLARLVARAPPHKRPALLAHPEVGRMLEEKSLKRRVDTLPPETQADYYRVATALGRPPVPLLQAMSPPALAHVLNRRTVDVRRAKQTEEKRQAMLREKRQAMLRAGVLLKGGEGGVLAAAALLTYVAASGADASPAVAAGGDAAVVAVLRELIRQGPPPDGFPALPKEAAEMAAWCTKRELIPKAWPRVLASYDALPPASQWAALVLHCESGMVAADDEWVAARLDDVVYSPTVVSEVIPVVRHVAAQPTPRLPTAVAKALREARARDGDTLVLTASAERVDVLQMAAPEEVAALLVHVARCVDGADLVLPVVKRAAELPSEGFADFFEACVSEGRAGGDVLWSAPLAAVVAGASTAHHRAAAARTMAADAAPLAVREALVRGLAGAMDAESDADGADAEAEAGDEGSVVRLVDMYAACVAEAEVVDEEVLSALCRAAVARVHRPVYVARVLAALADQPVPVGFYDAWLQPAMEATKQMAPGDAAKVCVAVAQVLERDNGKAADVAAALSSVLAALGKSDDANLPSAVAADMAWACGVLHGVGVDVPATLLQLLEDRVASGMKDGAFGAAATAAAVSGLAECACDPMPAALTVVVVAAAEGFRDSLEAAFNDSSSADVPSPSQCIRLAGAARRAGAAAAMWDTVTDVVEGHVATCSSRDLATVLDVHAQVAATDAELPGAVSEALDLLGARLGEGEQLPPAALGAAARASVALGYTLSFPLVLALFEDAFTRVHTLDLAAVGGVATAVRGVAEAGDAAPGELLEAILTRATELVPARVKCEAGDVEVPLGGIVECAAAFASLRGAFAYDNDRLCSWFANAAGHVALRVPDVPINSLAALLHAFSVCAPAKPEGAPLFQAAAMRLWTMPATLEGGVPTTWITLCEAFAEAAVASPKRQQHATTVLDQLHTRVAAAIATPGVSLECAVSALWAYGRVQKVKHTSAAAVLTAAQQHPDWAGASALFNARPDTVGMVLSAAAKARTPLPDVLDAAAPLLCTHAHAMLPECLVHAVRAYSTASPNHPAAPDVLHAAAAAAAAAREPWDPSTADNMVKILSAAGVAVPASLSRHV